MITAIGLSLLIGLSLGLLGGGGSILTVPILIYALDVADKPAIATSLLVVGVTSAVAAIQHARTGNVRWRIAGVFGAAGMLGAFLGGYAAKFIPSTVLLILFAVIMLATAVAMWRGKKVTAAGDEARAQPLPVGKIILEGLVVGLVTGMVGAGGGFLVVPALALMGGLKMREAVGTSLVIIAMKSFAGFAGYVSHVPVDYNLAALVTVSAIVGSFAGTFAAKRVNQESLRKGFALFVLAMAFYLLYQQLPEGSMSLLTNTWPFWAGGIAIGLVVVLFLWLTGKMFGVSSGYMDACMAVSENQARRSWRLPLIAGIVAGGALSVYLAGGISPSFEMGIFDSVFSSSIALKALVFTGGGVLIGYGARLAGGCTSGHSIVGVALLAPSSIIATGGFMVAGFLVTNFIFRFLA